MENESGSDSGDLGYQTVNSVLEDKSDRFGDKTFIFYGSEEKEISFEEMNNTANRVGNSLIDLGIKKQQKVSIMINHPLQTLFAHFGVNKSGAVYSPINPAYRGDVLSYQINDTNPEILIIEDGFINRLNDIKEDLNDLPQVVVSETDADTESLDDDFQYYSFKSLLEADPEKPDVEVSWNDVSSIIYTSGTTGRPKGVVIPHRWIFTSYNTQSIWGPVLTSEDVTHCPLPLYHIGGLYGEVTSPLTVGASVSLWDRFSPDNFWDRIEKYEATMTILISVMIPWLTNQPETEHDRENTLKMVTMTPLPENYKEFTSRFGIDFILPAYAQTEAGVCMRGLLHAAKGEDATPPDLIRGLGPDEIIEKSIVPVIDEVPGEGFMGKPYPNVEATVLNENDEELSPGEIGELAIRPKHPCVVMKEYYNKPERTVEAFQNLWLHTGDAVYRDEDDNYFFVDRIGDVIRRRGENISSIQIEEIVSSHDKVSNAAVFPVKAEEGGEDEIHAAVQTAGEDDLKEKDLLKYLESKMPEFMMPDEIWIVDEIPTTPTAKVEKYKLREKFSDKSDDN